MDFATALHAIVEQGRQKTFASSTQLSLGELILKLEAVSDKDKPCAFDFADMVPVGVSSWRGIYRELAIKFEKSQAPSVSQVLAMLNDAVGQEFTGYKGGEFRMSRQTPVWVANYGDSGFTGYKGSEEYQSVAVVGVSDGDTVMILTEAMEC